MMNLPRSLSSLKLVLDVKDGISATHALLSSLVLALCAEELLPECRVVAGCGCLLNDNLLPVV